MKVRALMAALALVAGACETKPGKEAPAKKDDGAKQPPGAAAPAKPPAPPEPPPSGEDPAASGFTLEQATAGLPGEGKKLMAKIATSKGDIVCELLPDLAPQTVASFVGLARGVRPWRDPQSGEWVKGKPFFDGLAFHRVKPGFMIQGGDPLSRTYPHERMGTGDPGFTVPGEFQTKVLFDRPGRLAMARSQDPNSAGSQFFITDGPAKFLNGKYTIFGQCENVDVVHAIASVKTGPPYEQDGTPSRPLEAVTMQVEIFRR